MSFDFLATLMTPFIDSHCHLTDPAFAQDLDAVIGRMKNAGMTAAVTIGCEDRDISNRFAHCWIVSPAFSSAPGQFIRNIRMPAKPMRMKSPNLLQNPAW